MLTSVISQINLIIRFIYKDTTRENFVMFVYAYDKRH